MPPSTIDHSAGFDREGHLRRNINFWGASAIMVGIIIGSGIFRTPPDIAGHLNSPWLILLMWVAGGVLSLLGAFTYAEMATMYPQAGGVYVFLREGYGRCMAFVFGWTYLLISKPAAAAGIALVFGGQLNDLIHLDHLLGMHDPSLAPDFVHNVEARADAARIITSTLLLALTIVNVMGNTLGSGVAMVLTALKVAALMAIIVLGFRTFGTGVFDLPSGGTLAVRDQPLALALVAVMSSVLWTYDGWSDVGAIAGEVKNPNRIIPRVYVTGTLAVILLYVGVNAVYMRVMPLETMRGVEDVAPTVAETLLGSAGLAVALIVLVSTAGSTHGSIITGARISYAQARDGLLFRALGHVNPRYGTPTVSLWVQLALSIGALWLLGRFSDLINSFVFTMWIFYGLAGASIFILRRRLPDMPRPYRCWGYPVTPALFVAAAAAMTVLSVIQDVTASETHYYTLIWLGVLLAGIPVYYIYAAVAKPIDE